MIFESPWPKVELPECSVWEKGELFSSPPLSCFPTCRSFSHLTMRRSVLADMFLTLQCGQTLETSQMKTWQSSMDLREELCREFRDFFCSPSFVDGSRPCVCSREYDETEKLILPMNGDRRGQLRELSQKTAHGFRRSGLNPGSVVLLFSPNTFYYHMIVLAAQCAGLVFSGANAAYVPAEFAHQVEDSGAELVSSSVITLDW